MQLFVFVLQLIAIGLQVLKLKMQMTMFISTNQLGTLLQLIKA
jgi:hypothetical protein